MQSVSSSLAKYWSPKVALGSLCSALSLGLHRNEASRKEICTEIAAILDEDPSCMTLFAEIFCEVGSRLGGMSFAYMKGPSRTCVGDILQDIASAVEKKDDVARHCLQMLLKNAKSVLKENAVFPYHRFSSGYERDLARMMIFCLGPKPWITQWLFDNYSQLEDGQERNIKHLILKTAPSSIMQLADLFKHGQKNLAQPWAYTAFEVLGQLLNTAEESIDQEQARLLAKEAADAMIEIIKQALKSKGPANPQTPSWAYVANGPNDSHTPSWVDTFVRLFLVADVPIPYDQDFCHLLSLRAISAAKNPWRGHNKHLHKKNLGNYIGTILLSGAKGILHVHYAQRNMRNQSERRKFNEVLTRVLENEKVWLIVFDAAQNADPETAKAANRWIHEGIKKLA